MFVTKSELIKRLAQRYPAFYYKDLSRIVELIFDEMALAMIDGKRIELRGFGSFAVRKREKRIARNPKTNEQLFLPERFTPYFRPGKELKQRINREEE